MRALVLLALALAAPALAHAGGHADVPCGSDGLGAACPDLLVDALETGAIDSNVEFFDATHCAVVEGLVEPGERALLRFPLTTANAGRGPVHIGRPADHPAWFTWSTCHGHAHFDGYAEYRLWTPDAYATWTSLRLAEPDRPASEVLAEHPALAADLVSGRKQGFCLMDTEALAPTFQAPGYPHCGWQGLSPGWVDRYTADLDGQWIDVTGLPTGYYVLELEVNPERRIAESDYLDNAIGWPMWIDPQV